MKHLPFRSIIPMALTLAGALGGLAAALPVAATAATTPAPPQTNPWGKVAEDATGGRCSPAFFYDAAEKRFWLVGGAVNPDNVPRHFEVETLDLETGKWQNTYPPGAPYKVAVGVTDAPVNNDYRGDWINTGKDGVQRASMCTAAFATDTRLHHQWAFDAASRQLYVSVWNKLWKYQLQDRSWTNTGAAPFSQGGFPMVWGNFAVDPVNHEIVAVGGSSDQPGGTPGTHVYSMAENRWRRVESGSPALRDLYAQATALRHQSWYLATACRNRYFAAETATEATASLAATGKTLAAAVTALKAAVQSAKASFSESAALQQAGLKLGQAELGLQGVTTELAAPMTPAALSAVAAIGEFIKSAELALATEPVGRAHSPLVYDPASGKMLLFGGNGLDGCYADTWLFDTKTHTWTQCFPKLSPAPRTGHALLYLPKCGKLALIGGNTVEGDLKPLPHEIWLYDLSTNTWKIMLHLPLGPKAPWVEWLSNSPNAPKAGMVWLGAVTPEDKVVMLDETQGARITWACQLDATKVSDTDSVTYGVPPGTRSCSVPPSTWESLPPSTTPLPSREETANVLTHLPVNQWVALKPPQSVPSRAWGTSVYDSDRQQFLWWGGGHVTYQATDVAHYSLRTNRWAMGYSPDLPLEPSCGHYVKAARSFQDRPQVPLHTWRSYAYDPPSGKMFWLSWSYDVARHEWDAAQFPGLEDGGAMFTIMETTPAGVVALAEKGLFRFNWEQKRWLKLPWNGPAFGKPWCDGNGFCYDSKRNCLWIANDTIFRYDLSTGNVTKLDIKRPAILGNWALWDDPVAVPEANVILLKRTFTGTDGKPTHVLFDPDQGKYFATKLPYVGAQPRDLSWSSGMRYDAKAQRLLLHDGFGQIFALKLDRNSLMLDELGVAAK